MQKQIEGIVRSKCRTLTLRICKRALEYREKLTQSGIGHNYTGNLINSIVCALYTDGKLDYTVYGSKLVGRPPIMAKMTNKKDGGGRTYYYGARFQEHLAKQRGKGRTNAYVSGHEGPDWDDGSSSYFATIRTDTTKTPEAEVQHFVDSYKPAITKGYVIVLAYPVEYADYIENLRSSTGLALVEDEYRSKIGQIQDWFVHDFEMTDVDSGLTKDIWDEIAAADEAFRMGGEVTADDVLATWGDYHIQPGKITLTTADEKASNEQSNEQFDDPFGAGPTEPAPF